MPNYPAPSPSYQDLHFIINEINNINNYIPSPIVNNNSYDDLSSWITYLLIQELNDNNPVTTEIITNYINNISPSYSNNSPSSPTTIIVDHDDDHDLYDSDDSMPPLIDDYSDSFSGFTHPSSEG